MFIFLLRIPAIKCLKSKKTDGLFDIVSDNVLHGHPKLHDHMAKLLSACLVHGYILEVMTLSTVIPIPKDVMGDYKSSSNYRGIALCILFMKVCEYVILKKYGDSLKTNDLQYAYKSGLSTTQCTWVAR